jgi:phenylpyruvate tautomerase PptA (4-oxalocrotonate tautomerase family)
MPLITIKVFEDELSDSQSQDLICRVTEAIVPFVGEKLRGGFYFSHIVSVVATT